MIMSVLLGPQDLHSGAGVPWLGHCSRTLFLTQQLLSSVCSGRRHWWASKCMAVNCLRSDSVCSDVHASHLEDNHWHLQCWSEVSAMLIRIWAITHVMMVLLAWTGLVGGGDVTWPEFGCRHRDIQVRRHSKSLKLDLSLGGLPQAFRKCSGSNWPKLARGRPIFSNWRRTHAANWQKFNWT